MFNESQPEKISRSVSHNDQSDQSLLYLRDQSSCSSLTSGIGFSDQSICNDQTPTSERELPRHTSLVSQTTFCSKLTDDKVTLQQSVSISDQEDFNKKLAANVPQYLRAPPVAKPTDQVTSDHKKDVEAVITEPSTLAINSEESDESQQRLRSDIKEFVDITFTDSQSISLEKKAEFGQLMRTPEARLLFAIFVDDYRVNSKRVSELTFYSLAQYFSIVLLECLLAEDFRPAKIIMNMMFTYYFEQTLDKIPPRERLIVLGQDHLANKTVITYDEEDQETISTDPKLQNGEPKTVKTYLYTLLKDQEIFKSIRFWTSAFYESVIVERNNHPVFVDKQPGKLSSEKRDEELDCSKNITFGLLGSFIHNMCLLDLSHDFCQEFLDKHSTIAGLSDCQLEMLRSNLKAMFRETLSDRTPISQATASDRLSKFLSKLSTRLNNQSSATST